MVHVLIQLVSKRSIQQKTTQQFKNILKVIQEIASKVKQITAERNKLQLENAELLDQKDQLYKHLLEAEEKNAELEKILSKVRQLLLKEEAELSKSIEKLKTSGTTATMKKRVVRKKQLEQYIQLIEECIGMTNK